MPAKWARVDDAKCSTVSQSEYFLEASFGFMSAPLLVQFMIEGAGDYTTSPRINNGGVTLEFPQIQVARPLRPRTGRID